MKHKKALHRIFAYICALSLVFSGIAEASVSDKNLDEALIVFGNELETVNATVIQDSATMSSISAAPDGTPVWKFKGSGSRPYLYIDLPNSLGSSYEDGSVYDIEIKYFDSNTGYCIVWYDAIKWGKQVGYKLYATATNTWKTAKFTIDNAYFKNSVDEKGDIMLSFKERGTKLSTTPFPVDIASVKIVRRQKANPVLAESYLDTYGNTFAYFADEKIVHNEITNTTNKKQAVNVEFCLVDTELGDKVFSETKAMVLQPKETLLADVNVKTERCGVYNWHVNITNNDGTINSIFKEDTIGIIKTDPNGIKSEWQGICTHGAQASSNGDHTLTDLIAAANFGAIRIDPKRIQWENLERVPGIFNFSTFNTHMRALEHAKTLGLKTLGMLMSSHAYYEGTGKWSGSTGWMPSTPEAKEGYERYVEFVAKNLAPYYDYWEVWNEPNIASFNPNGGTPEDLTDITKRARKIIDKYDPGAYTLGMSITEIAREDGIEWRDAFFEAGIVDGDNGMNALALHPYQHKDSPEVARMADHVKLYRDMALEYGKTTGVEDMPVFLTEYGYSGADAFAAGKNRIPYPIRESILHKAHGVGENLFYYVFEQKGIIETDREDMFGIVSPVVYNGKYNIEGKIAVVTPVYVAFAGMNYVLGGKCEPDGVWELDNKVYMNRFKSDKFGKNILAFWGDDVTESLTLDLGVDRVDYYDIYGNKKEIYGKDGIFTFIANERPAYIVGNFKENRVVNYAPLVEYSNLKLDVPVNDKALLTITTDEENNYEAIVKNYGEDATPSIIKFENGKAEVLVEASGAIGNESVVEIDICDGEKVIASNKIAYSVRETLNSEVLFEVSDSGNYDDWRGIFKITNYSLGRQIKGYAEFSEPAEFKALGKIDLGTIEPDSISEVKFDISNLTEKGKRNIVYKIVDEGSPSEPFEFETQYDFNIATRPKSKVVIDGIADEWPTNTAMSASAPSNFVPHSNANYCDPIPSDSPENKSASVRVMWDEENLYMYTEVIDDVYFQNEDIQNSWKTDGIQFGVYVDIGEDEFTAFGQSNTNYHEYTVAIYKDSNEVGIYKSRVQDDKTKTGFVEVEAKAVRKGKITTYEWAIPWENMVGIDGWHPNRGQILKFSMLWNDNDGAGRKGWVEYASGIGASKDNRLFTGLLLLD